MGPVPVLPRQRCTVRHGHGYYVEFCNACIHGWELCPYCYTPPHWIKRPIRANTGPPRWRIDPSATLATFGTNDTWVYDFHFLREFQQGKELI